MLELRYPGRWQTAGAVLLLAVLCATVMPDLGWWPDSPRPSVPNTDKIAHFVVFCGLALWFSGQYARQRFWRIGIGLLAYGALIELVQSMLSYRSAEWLDLVADGLGIVVGLVIAMAGVAGWSVRVENALSGP